MAQRIIVVHGRSTKPAKAKHAVLLKRALLQGLARVDPAKAEKVSNGGVKLDFVYYGDINNEILAATSPKIQNKLTDRDPDSNNTPCVPADRLGEAVDALGDIKRFDKRAYRKILKHNSGSRFLDDLAAAVSTLSAITTATFLNELVIKTATADLGAYLMRQSIGSKIRDRLQTPLRAALTCGDDICLVTHSMGCMVAYDVLWKFSRMSEYRDVQNSGNRVSQWITLGCPLGEAGVKANLYDANERSHEGGTDKYPYKIIRKWQNISAHDDFISHDPTMKNDYRLMLKYDHLDSIRDQRIYNCWSMDGKANPHKFYGYLANPATAKHIAYWMN